MSAEQLRIGLAVMIWVASSIIVIGYLYFFGRLVSYLKRAHPGLWRSLKKPTGLRPLPGWAGPKMSYPEYQFLLRWLLLGRYRGLPDPELNRLAGVTKTLGLAGIGAVLVSLGAVYLLTEGHP